MYVLCCSWKWFPPCCGGTAQSMAHYCSLCSWLQVSALLWCPELTSVDEVVSALELHGRDMLLCHCPGQCWDLGNTCNEIYKPERKDVRWYLCKELRHGLCQSFHSLPVSHPPHPPPAKQTYETASDPCWLPAGCLMGSAKWLMAFSQLWNSKSSSPC